MKIPKFKIGWPTKKEWNLGYRPCLRCGVVMKPKEYNQIKTPPEFLGQPFDWIHKKQVMVYTEEGIRYYCKV